MKIIKIAILLFPFTSAQAQVYLSEGVYSDTLSIFDDMTFNYSFGSNFPFFEEGEKISGNWRQVSIRKISLTTFRQNSRDSINSFISSFQDSLENKIYIEFIDQEGKFALDFYPLVITTDGDTVFLQDSNIVENLDSLAGYKFQKKNIQKICVLRLGVKIDYDFEIENQVNNHFKIFVKRGRRNPKYMKEEIWVKRKHYLISQKHPHTRFKLLRYKSP